MALGLTSLNSFAAPSTFKIIYACEMIDKIMEVNINVQKDAKGAVRMEIKPEGQRPFTVNARELLAPRMMAGGATRYVAKISVQGLFNDLGMVCKGL